MGRCLDRKDGQEVDLEERGDYSLLGEAGAGEGEEDKGLTYKVQTSIPHSRITEQHHNT